MNKDSAVSEVLSLPQKTQRELLALLQARWGAQDVTLTQAQLRELDSRIERFDREGPRGEKWQVVEKRLLKARAHARHSR